MASILILSRTGEGIPLAHRLVQEGHIVKMFFKDRQDLYLTGFKNPSRVENPRKMVDQYDLILSDSPGLGQEMEWFYSQKKVTLGGGQFTDRLELTQDYSQKVLTFLGLDHPPHRVFSTWQSAVTYLKEMGKEAVVESIDHPPLFSTDPFNRTVSSYVESLELQPCIVYDYIKGVKLTTTGWFNSHYWVGPFALSIKKPTPQGDVVWLVEKNRLVDRLLTPLTGLLNSVEYSGPFSITTILKEDEVYFKGFKASFDYDSIQAYTELVKGTLFDYLYSLANAKDETPKVYNDHYAVSVRLTTNPIRGLHLVDVPKEAQKHVWLKDTVQRNGSLLLGGVDGVIGCVTARGLDLRECQRRVYRTISNILLCKSVSYREDIHRGIEEEINLVKKWGWLDASSSPSS